MNGASLGTDGANDGANFVGMVMLIPDIYNHPISTVDFTKIKKFLSKKGRMTRIAKLAKRNFTSKKPKKKGYPKIIKFKNPTKFVKKPLKGGGGKRTRKYYHQSKNYTLKKH